MDQKLNLSDVYVFKKVASTLSFTEAARRIGMSRSAVSKQVSRLERALGVMLVNRTTRSVNLTEAGRTFDAQTEKIDTTIERAADLVRGADIHALGTVSFTLPSGLGAALMPALATQFQSCWPDLRLNIHFDDQARDLVASNLDLAIRISRKLTDSSLISRRIASTKMVLAASPQYLRDHGSPRDLADLKNHRCLGLGSALTSATSWKLQNGDQTMEVSTTLAISANNDLALILAACLNSGIIFMPEICIAAEVARKRLQVISCCQHPDQYGVYALYRHRNAAAKVKALVDFIEDILPHVASLDRWTPSSDRLADIPNTDFTETHAREQALLA